MSQRGKVVIVEGLIGGGPFADTGVSSIHEAPVPPPQRLYQPVE